MGRVPIKISIRLLCGSITTTLCAKKGKVTLRKGKIKAKSVCRV